eukprot:CAMPEP_0175397820 /NCGR_PEP_ID=MMETSP0095-20121207/35171_1 /TAXON_ID=311494 /ORGANISM="Alexandrium monilatum, Strain CCMP3105" /LENGTH=110 /DNA_ID=CAMNT_0016696513 /DNA_START=44 /DNA_END=373 /DNA_ORIENTATION=+
MSNTIIHRTPGGRDMGCALPPPHASANRMDLARLPKRADATATWTRNADDVVAALTLYRWHAAAWAVLRFNGQLQGLPLFARLAFVVAPALALEARLGLAAGRENQVVAP